MSLRYLEADRVELQSSAPAFVEQGRCYWCNEPLTGKTTKFCRPTEEWKRRYQLNYAEPVISECTLYFHNYWYSRPAYVRATFIRDNFTCQQCGYHEMLKDRPWLPDMSNLECDHIIPLAKGGETAMANLQTLCKEHNRQKGIKVANDLEEGLPRVIPSRDNSKCPNCGAHGYLLLPWLPPEFYDPLMKKVRCTRCGEISFIGPRPEPQRTRRTLHASRS